MPTGVPAGARRGAERTGQAPSEVGADWACLRAVRSSWSTVAAQLANRHADLAETYAGAGAVSRAIEEYERALELGPEFHDLRYRMARLLMEAGRALEAREALERVLEARPSFVDAQAALGLAHYLSGDADGAREVWQACLTRRPENARVEAYLSMLARTAQS